MDKDLWSWAQKAVRHHYFHLHARHLCHERVTLTSLKLGCTSRTLDEGGLATLGRQLLNFSPWYTLEKASSKSYMNVDALKQRPEAACMKWSKHHSHCTEESSMRQRGLYQMRLIHIISFSFIQSTFTGRYLVLVTQWHLGAMTPWDIWTL